MLLVSPFAGVVADRYSKRRVLVVTQAAMGLSSCFLGLLAVTGSVTAWHVYATALVFGIGTAFDRPTRQAYVNEVVDRDILVNAVGLNSASLNIGRAIGPAIAGLLIAWFGSGIADTGAVILLNGISFFIVIVSLLRMRTADMVAVPPPARTERALREIRDGLNYVKARPDLMLVLTVTFIFGTFGMNFQLTTALMSTQVYDKGAAGFGILGTILTIGSLTGSLTSARRSNVRMRTFILGAVALGSLEVVAGLMPTYLSFALILPLCGFASMTTHVAANTYVQMTSDAAVRGQRHGAVPRLSHGRHADRRSRARLGRRAMGGPLDAHRRRGDHGDLHDHHRRRVRPPPEPRHRLALAGPRATAPRPRSR